MLGSETMKRWQVYQTTVILSGLNSIFTETTVNPSFSLPVAVRGDYRRTWFWRRVKVRCFEALYMLLWSFYIKLCWSYQILNFCYFLRPILSSPRVSVICNENNTITRKCLPCGCWAKVCSMISQQMTFEVCFNDHWLLRLYGRG